MMYARSQKTVYKMAVGPNDRVAPEQLQFGEDVDLDQGTFVKLTGTLSTTIIHQAIVRDPPFIPINLLRLKQLLCDVTIICSTNHDQTD